MTKKAYEIYEKVTNEFHYGHLDIDPQQYLLLDDFEYTAFGNTASFGIIEKWRKEGWPEVCHRCDKKMNFKQYGWTIINDKLVCLF